MEDQALPAQQARLVLQLWAIVARVHASFYPPYAEWVEAIPPAVSGELPRVIVDAVNLQSNRKSPAVSGFYSCSDNSRQSDAKEGLR